MKFGIKKVLLMMLIVSLIGSCSKQFLDLTPPASIPIDQAIVDENSMSTAMNGVYSSLRNVDFFGRTLPIDGDLLADNIYIDPIQNSNRYLIDETYTYTETYGNIQATWSEAYNTILRTNNIINANVPSSPVADQLKGEALTIRALSYFELVKFFAKPYLTDPSSLGVPIVLTYDPFAKPGRSTVAQVYDQIEKDLTDAFTLMTDETKNSSYITKYAARALQARFYQFKGDWASAGDAALDVVTTGGYTLTDSASLEAYWSNPFPVANKVETIFEVEFDNIGNNGTDNLSNFYDQAGYGDALCTDDLYFSYSPTDARRNLIIAGQRGGRPVWVVNKYSNTSNTNGKDATKIIRYAEVLLILAEAYVRSGDDGTAQSVLNQLAKKRDPQFTGYTTVGSDLFNDVYLERRRELAFEGHRYWDFVRANQDIERSSGSNYGPNVPLFLSKTDTKRIWPIPRAELDANKNMVQNDGY